jgi:hypothetical protein
LKFSDGEATRIGARELAEAGDGKDNVLERVERCVFGRRWRKRVRGREKARSACEVQVRLALGRRAQGRGVLASGRKEMNELESRGTRALPAEHEECFGIFRGDLGAEIGNQKQ